ncbi:MAG: nucleotide exchange factor GrpE [Clostridia bacterium]|nr:nucleotide exchange factor GrpE [Clostridia bacterium]
MEPEKKTKKTTKVTQDKAEKAQKSEEISDNEAFIAKLNEDLETQKQRAEEYYDSLKRNMAEFDNFKKRISKEKEGLYTSIVSEVIETMLPIIDNFEKAMAAESKDEGYKNGIELIYKDLLNLLKKYNVEAIEDIGHTFDPMFHEAVMSVTDETKGEKEIVEVFRRGYKIGDKIVRHSLVKVAN